MEAPRWIINFPTKQHWRNPSEIEWIEDGLQDLVRFIREHKVKSIALPALGCGNGGLDWKSVRPLIESAMGGLEDVQIVIYEPTAQSQNVAKPRMSKN
jgi:O-acetyl-ADP-ribose deacetylase (regulator of RNase III)